MSVRFIYALIVSFTRYIEGKQEGFIVGGETAKDIKEFAFCVFLDINDMFNCGSSIVNQNILLTAAHCLEEAKVVIATAGSLDRNAGKKISVAKYWVHRQYSEKTIMNDIGLCRLKKPLQLGRNIKRVVLMKRPPADPEGIVAGWGAVNENNWDDTHRLKQSKQKLWTHRNCKNILKDLLPAGTLCGGERASNTNFASKGDSGGPLVVRKCIQVGLVSFRNSAKTRSLVVYTNVSYFYDWIMTNMQKLACQR